MKRALLVALALGAGLTPDYLPAQGTAIRALTLDPGLDTTVAPLGEIVRTLDAYLHLPNPGQTPTDLWTAEGRPQAGAYDLTARMAYQGFDAQVLEISQTYEPDSVYLLKTAYFSPDSTVPSRLIALQRLYARLEHGRWVLSPALPRATTTWDSTTVGVITYHYPPSLPIDTVGARRAATFVDSLAAALSVPRPARIDYYLGESTDQVYRLIGLDYFLSPSGPGTGRGGFAMPREGVVLAGNPSLGAAYTHELVHVVLATISPSGGRLYVMEEGTPAWLGGSGGKPYAKLLAGLQGYQQEHPSISLWNLLDGHLESGWGNPETQALYATAAMIADAIYRRGGSKRLREALEVPGSASLKGSFFPTFLGVPVDGVDTWWRQQPAHRLQEVAPEKLSSQGHR